MVDTRLSDSGELGNQPSQLTSVHATLDARELELLLLIADAASPLGARELGRRMSVHERMSESTVNRLLSRLDEQGLTRSYGGRGRVLSPAGRLLAERAASEQRWHQQLGSLEIRTLSDVRDLVAARRGLEREIARAAALTATADDIVQLRRFLGEYDRSINTESLRRDVATDFHKALASMSKNAMLKAAAMVLFDSRFDVFEQVLDIVTASRGRTHEGPHEHDAIVEAIAASDPDAAEAAMVHHLDRLAEDASAEVSPSTLLAIELFLRSHPTSTNFPSTSNEHNGDTK